MSDALPCACPPLSLGNGDERIRVFIAQEPIACLSPPRQGCAEDATPGDYFAGGVTRALFAALMERSILGTA
jgi:hypothetical protein